MESKSILDPRRMLALTGLVVVFGLLLLLGSSSGAKAETLSSYCGNQTLAGYESCWGAQRTLYAVYGWGDQHSVCVGTSAYTNTVCSSGAGAGAYAPVGTTDYLWPWIQNNAGGSNRVHGVAYQP